MSAVSRFLDPVLVQRLNQLQMSARNVVEGSINGLHRSPVRGASIEFRQHRAYAPGDEIRRLDWRLLGRTDRTFVKEYDEETNLRCLLMLDVSGSMGYGGQRPPRSGPDPAIPRPPTEVSRTKLEYASRLAAALAYLMLRQTESVGLASFGSGLAHWLPPRSGLRQLAHLTDQLEKLSPAGPSTLADALIAAADRLERRTLIVVLSDCFSPVEQLNRGLLRLKHGRHETIIVQVLHRDEVQFPFKRWVRMNGLEGETAQLCEPAAARQLYLDNFRRHRAELERQCRSASGDYYSFVTDRPLIEAVTTVLRRRTLR